MDIHLILTGAIIGVLIGLTGMGGGSLMTPILIFFLGIKPTLAVGSDLVCNAITKIVGGGVHFYQKTAHHKIILYLALGSLPSSLLGVRLIQHMKLQASDAVEVYVAKALGFTLIIVAATLFLKSFLTNVSGRSETSAEKAFHMDRSKKLKTILIGAVVGFLVGLTSVGSGTLIVMAMVILYPTLSPRTIVGTDVIHGAFLVSVAGLAHYQAGNIDSILVMNLLLGSVPGVILGSRLTTLCPAGVLRPILASVLMISGLKLI
jgi:uncharacterized membrane protein YfcA